MCRSARQQARQFVNLRSTLLFDRCAVNSIHFGLTTRRKVRTKLTTLQFGCS
jgi:hypothetical protein